MPWRSGGSRSGIDALLSVCMESRSVVLKHYLLVNTSNAHCDCAGCLSEEADNTLSGIDPATDELYLDASLILFDDSYRWNEMFSKLSDHRAMRIDNFFGKVQDLEVRGLIWNNTYEIGIRGGDLIQIWKSMRNLKTLQLIPGNIVKRPDIPSTLAWDGRSHGKEELLVRAFQAAFLKLSSLDPSRTLPKIILHKWRPPKGRPEEERNTDLWSYQWDYPEDGSS